LPKLFKYADNETVAILASDRRDAGKYVSVRYAEVPTGQSDEFFADFKVSAERMAKLDVSPATKEFTLWIPPKGSIFARFEGGPTLGQVANIRQGLHWIPRADKQPRTAPRSDVASDAKQDGFLLGAEKMKGNLSQMRIDAFRFLSVLEKHHHPRDKAWRNPWRQPKVVCNAARFERKSPWRLAAWADSVGLAFTKRYFAMWPVKGISENALAAVLSSPFGSAFTFERDLGIDNRITTLSRLPLPKLEHLSVSGSLHEQAKRLQSLLSPRDFAPQPSTPEITEALIRLDAAVLHAYGLPARLQRQLLNQFQGWKRPVAVPFTGYFPAHFKDALTLNDFVAIQYDWDITNERRCDLIEKDLSRTGLARQECEELDHLQHLADLLVRLKEPYPVEELSSLVADLKAKGKWKSST
jgi:hypothetical protein